MHWNVFMIILMLCIYLSIYMLMPWHCVPLRHQQPRCGLAEFSRFISHFRQSFQCETVYVMQIIIYVSSEQMRV